MEITSEQVKAAFNTFKNNPNNANLDAYKELKQAKETQDKETKLNEFKETIKLRNKYYKVLNEIAPKICNILNNYTDSIATVNGTIRKSLETLLPKHENIRYYVTNFGNLEIYYTDGIKFKDSYIFYKNDNYSFNPFELINFKAEYKKANKYLQDYQKAYELLSSRNVNMYFKDYLTKNNHISKINF